MSPNIKNSWKIAIALSPFLSSALLFQNCSSQTQWAADLSSEVEMLEQEHINRDHGSEEKAKRVTTYRPLLSDRRATDLILNDIFNDGSVDDLSVVATYIATKNETFGTPCSFYSDYKTSGSVRYEMLSFCPLTDSMLNAAVNPDTLVSREAYLAYVCETSVNTTATLNTALKKISSQAATVLPTASDANLLKMFQLFYRAKPNPQAGLIQALKILFANPSAPTRDEWKAAFYATCVSGYWQVQ